MQTLGPLNLSQNVTYPRGLHTYIWRKLSTLASSLSVFYTVAATAKYASSFLARPSDMMVLFILCCIFVCQSYYSEQFLTWPVCNFFVVSNFSILEASKNWSRSSLDLSMGRHQGNSSALDIEEDIVGLEATADKHVLSNVVSTARVLPEVHAHRQD